MVANNLVSMSDKEKLIDTLTCPNSMLFSASHAEASAIKKQFANLRKIEINGNAIWFLNDQPNIANTKIKVYPTGHMVFYNSEGKRFLFTDPEGHPLHECEWKKDEISGETRLAFVRMQLDSRQWFGIKPGAKTFSTRLDIKGHPGWENMTLDDLRRKAAEAWRIPLAEVEYFYKDSSFEYLGEGQYDVCLSKDGLYVLTDGTFDRAIFISYMPMSNWEPIDILPVVELFQSVPLSAGGAGFELFWGLCDDYSRKTRHPPLRFRGLPAYPSQKAFEIFSAFFSPTSPEGEDLMDVFMDYKNAYRITWDPVSNPPWRYFCDEQGVCLTVQDHYLYKVTVLNDPAALPFINCSRGGRAPCQRQALVKKNSILLMDGDDVYREIPLQPQWQISPQEESGVQQPAYPFNWRWFFKESLPKADPAKAILTVPFYPEGPSEIEESSLQPMVVDQILHYMAMFPSMPRRLEKINSVLIHNFDTVIAGCIDCAQEREYTVLFNDPEFAQKNAQLLWEFAASRNQLEALRQVSFLSEKENAMPAYKKKFEMIFRWIPFSCYPDTAACNNILHSVAQALAPNALLFLVGPRQISDLLHRQSLNIIYDDRVQDMPFFLQHQKMYPETQVNPDAAVFFAEKITSRKSVDMIKQAEMESACITNSGVMEIALKKEKEEKRFYLELAGYAANHKVRKFLLSMAEESDEHENEIRKLLADKKDGFCGRGENKTVKRFIETHFQTDIFPSLGEISKIAPQLEGVHKALDFAVEKERVAAEFFAILGKYCEDFSAKTACVLLEKLEFEHAAKIESFRKEFLLEPYN